MSTYQGIRGLKVRDYTTNPDNPLEGQLWYNKTDQVGKYQVPVVTTAWRTSFPANSGRFYSGSSGTPTSFLMFGGEAPPPATQHAQKTESFNGSAFTEVNDMNTARIFSRGSAGVSNTAALVFSGWQPPHTTNCEQWDGSSWTETTNVNTQRYLGMGTGSSTQALFYGGYSGTANLAVTEQWNGSAWTEVADLNTARYQQGATGGGSSDNTTSIVFGGQPGKVTNTETWNGSSWTEIADLSKGREGPAGGGTSNTAAIASIGITPPGNTATLDTEELTVDAPVGAWSSGGDLNTARYEVFGTGLQTAALIYGGTEPPQTGKTESYDGTSWTEVNDLNTARGAGGSAGTYTSALAFGGEGPPEKDETESWNGSNWTEVADLNEARRLLGGAGASNTAALAFGGYNGSSNVNSTENWNGSSWTEVNNLNTTRNNLTGTGTNTAALAMGGFSTPGSSREPKVEQWNGSSWTEVGDLNTGRTTFAANGTTTSALAYGGTTPAVSPNYLARTEDWNGLNWVEVADLSTGRSGGGGAGADVNSGLYFGGSDGSTYQSATEEWNGSSNSTKTIDTD